MGVEYLDLEQRVTSLGGIVTPKWIVLPEVAPQTFERALTELNDHDLARLLRKRLLPLTRPSSGQMYADAAPWRGRYLTHPQIVAQIPPWLFAKTVWERFSPRLAEAATYSLFRNRPEFSAYDVITLQQGICIVLMILGVAALFINAPLSAAIDGLCLAFSLVFFGMAWIRFLALISFRRSRLPSPAEMNDSQLPTYSVLVPLYKEAEVLPQLVRALGDLSYPPDKLDIKIILEEKDVATRKAAYAFTLPPHMELLVVPAGKPQTKPRALNYALHFARGELLTIFDAEDIPDPMQLRRAARAFAVLPHTVACLQAELAFHNGDENWLARQFTVEYAVQFRMILPTLAHRRLPLPLGGTSNHFRTAVLRHVHAWDAHNVTEDADIGLRLARAGFRSSVIRSATLEEANIRLGNWLWQRARWNKGFLQTWLVHMRHPLRLLREIGPLGFITVQSTLLGVALSALLHPVLLGLMIWQLTSASSPLHWLLVNGPYFFFLVSSYAVMMTCGILATRGKKLSSHAMVIMTMPLYWLLTSVAGWMGLWQLITRPHHWNKTRHGLSRVKAPKPSASPA